MRQATIELYQRVALTRDLPEHNLCKGDVAVVVEHLPGTLASGGEAGYALEVFNAVGGSQAPDRARDPPGSPAQHNRATLS